MPIANVQDAREVDRGIQNILSAPDLDDRLRTIRTLFVEVLDFERADQRVSLESAGNSQLPKNAHIAARRDGISVAYIPLDDTPTNRVTGAVASAAAKAIGNVLEDDLLLLFTNRDRDQLHIISPDLTGARTKLQRLVAHRGEDQRTVAQQIANMWDDYGNLGKTTGQAITRAFSVEPVTREFFETYRRLFEDAKGQIRGFKTDEEEQKHLFTQTLFNRLMFVYFLSRKGWLKFNDDTDYLDALWQDYAAQPGPSNFYTARLTPLFFAGLNNPQSMNLMRDNPVLYRTIGDVPFLNGGLFEETDLDKRRAIGVPDETIGGILKDLFDKFNFTVMESTPYDVEVAVDPEMLGKVFEELVTGRHDSGAYYTPRPVVSFMCREALKGYLEGKDTGLEAAAIAQFVEQHDTSGINLAAARRVSEALAEVTVVDPACGSGAYLLGMMQELIELQTVLYNAGVDAKAMYQLKLEIIQRNLYGVDIDEFAVNIAMLRMWLSLAIDYEGDEPEPLLNLDFKVLCGDSLLGPDPSAGVEVQGTLGHDMEQFRQLGQLKAEYMRVSLGADKDQLRSQIEGLTGQIRKALNVAATDGVVDGRIEFAEVFAERRGFDIAIANPPYIQLQKDGGKLANLYRDAGYQTTAPRGDIYQLFYERGCQLLMPSRGLLAYITSNSWLKADYGKSTRRYFADNHTPVILLELGKDVFESAIVDSSCLMLRTGGSASAFPAVDMDRIRSKNFPPDTQSWSLVKPDGDAPWRILSRLEQSVVEKMQAKGTPLKEWDVAIFRGITTGLNDAFIIDDDTKKALVAADPKSAEIVKPILRGRDIQRYQGKWANLWVIIAKFGSYRTMPEEYPAVYEHLAYHEEQLRARGQCRYSRSRKNDPNADYQGQHHWVELDNNPKDQYLEEFAKEKLVWIELAQNGRFAYDDSGIFCSNSAYILSGTSIKYLCAVLNSTLTTWFMNNTALTSGMGATRWIKSFVDLIPIPKITTAEQHPFVRLVDEILKNKAADPNADTRHLEWEIDRLVYELYGLTEEEDTAVERSLGLIHQTDEEEDAALARMMDEAMADPENVADERSRAEFEAIVRSWREEELADEVGD